MNFNKRPGSKISKRYPAKRRNPSLAGAKIVTTCPARRGKIYPVVSVIICQENRSFVLTKF